MKSGEIARGFILVGIFAICFNIYAAPLTLDNKKMQMQEPVRNKKEFPKGLIDLVNKPTSPIDFLENMKIALDLNLLVQREFFQEENVKFFFSASTPQCGGGGKNPEDLWVNAYDFGELFKGAEVNGISYLGADLRLELRVNSDGGKKGSIRLLIPALLPKPRVLYFDDVEKVFGKKWKISTMSAYMLLHRPTVPAIAPHGNERIEYSFDDFSFNKAVHAYFNDDASLAGILVSEEAK